MADNFTELNQGMGGSVMDESSVTYSMDPTTRMRPRVVIGGDASADELAEVIPTDPSQDDYGLTVRAIPHWSGCAGNQICEWGEAQSVPAATQTTIISLIVPTGLRYVIKGFSGSGNMNGKFCFYMNNVLMLTGRNSIAVPNLQLSFLDIPVYCDQSQIITLSVTQYNNGIVGDFEGTILGYSIPIPTTS